MSADDDPTTVRDLKIMGRGVFIAAGCATLVVGSIITGVVYLVNLSNRVAAVEGYVAEQKQELKDAKRREEWRRDRERGVSTPGAQPKGGM